MHFIFLYPYFFYISFNFLYYFIFATPLFLTYISIILYFFKDGINEFTFSQFLISN